MRNWGRVVRALCVWLLAIAVLLLYSEVVPSAGAQPFCEDFKTQEEAQQYMEQFPEEGEGLDPNLDGVACARLPTATPGDIATNSGGGPLEATEIDIAGDALPGTDDASADQEPRSTPATIEEAQTQLPDLDCRDFLQDDREIGQILYDEMTEDSDHDARAVQLILDPDGNDIPCDHDEFSPTKPKQPQIGALAAPPVTAVPITLNGYLDGEMITARVGDVQETIRMIGVDTPEIERWECFSFDALDSVRAILPNDSTYYIEYEPELRGMPLERLNRLQLRCCRIRPTW